MIAVHNVYRFLCQLNFMSFLDCVETVTTILASIAGGICAVIGISYLRVLRQKRVSATFSFWIQLRVRIEELQRALKDDKSIINGMYSSETRYNWPPDATTATDAMINRFYCNVEETLQFIKGAADQIPADSEWLDSYMKLVVFLIDILQYDIRNQNSGFKFFKGEKSSDRDNYCEEICNIMEKIINAIDARQNEVARKI